MGPRVPVWGLLLARARQAPIRLSYAPSPLLESLAKSSCLVLTPHYTARSGFDPSVLLLQFPPGLALKYSFFFQCIFIYDLRMVVHAWPLMTALGRLRQEDQEIKTTRSYKATR